MLHGAAEFETYMMPNVVTAGDVPQQDLAAGDQVSKKRTSLQKAQDDVRALEEKYDEGCIKLNELQTGPGADSVRN